MSEANLNLFYQPSECALTHIWNTSVLKGINGDEQRSALYTWPRVGLKLRFNLPDSTKLNWWRRKLFKYVDGLWAIPFWMDRTTIIHQAEIGETKIKVGDNRWRHFYAGRDLLIINPTDFSIYEIINIQEVKKLVIWEDRTREDLVWKDRKKTNEHPNEGFVWQDWPSYIILNTALTKQWPIGSLVMPLYDFRFTEAPLIQKIYRDYDTIDLTIDEAFESIRTFSYNLPDVRGSYTFDGFTLDQVNDVLLHMPRQSFSYQVDRPPSIMKFLGIGYKYSYYDNYEAEQIFNFSFTERSKRKIWELLEFFDNRMGRLSTFFFPTWNKDIIVTSAIGAEDTILEIEDIEWTTYYGANANCIVGKCLCFRIPNGNYYFRYIVSAGDSTHITLDSKLGIAIAAGDLDKLFVSFLVYGRFDNDGIEILYQKNDSIARVNLSLTGIPKAYTEMFGI